ncbi:MAG: Gfo/Idh/MocA family oxidoreductase [Nannocystaceae bacterium]|nr:Gfo/Idh/MocA family oxidoreductase [Nannocystaceae bacterium]
MKNFAVVGLGGFVAPRHLKAIKATGNRVVAAIDLHDSVGIIDSQFPEARFFTEIERFDRHLEKLRRQTPEDKVDFVSVCTPNYLHDAHVRLALRLKAHAICEKPLVINPWNLDQLAEIEAESGRRVYNVLQLRLHPALVELKARLDKEPQRERALVDLTYITRRGAWYDIAWKGDERKSGGVAMNIGIHFFDALMWMFGPPQKTVVHLRDQRRMSGVIELERATVRWFLSVDGDDLPEGYLAEGKHAYRSMNIAGEEVEFSRGFADLHTRVYEDILAGGGFGIEDARPSIELVSKIRTADVSSAAGQRHPVLDLGHARDPR